MVEKFEGYKCLFVRSSRCSCLKRSFVVTVFQALSDALLRKFENNRNLFYLERIIKLMLLYEVYLHKIVGNNAMTVVN